MREILEVGIYVRTYSGDIVQISENERRAFIDFKNKIGMFYEPEKTIKKSSPNIIDLIEVGDYVNGYKIMLNDDEQEIGYFGVERHIILDTRWWSLLGTDIKEILTKEQFENNCYRVERK